MSGAARSRSVSLSFKMSIIMSRYMMLVLLEVGMAIDRKGERAEGGLVACVHLTAILALLLKLERGVE